MAITKKSYDALILAQKVPSISIEEKQSFILSWHLVVIYSIKLFFLYFSMVGLDELAYFVDLQLFLGQGSLKVQKPGMTEWHNVLGEPDIFKIKSKIALIGPNRYFPTFLGISKA